MKNIEIIKFEDYSDIRGALFSVSEADIVFLDKIQNIHFGKIHPNSIRGNHFIVNGIFSKENPDTFSKILKKSKNFFQPQRPDIPIEFKENEC